MTAEKAGRVAGADTKDLHKGGGELWLCERGLSLSHRQFPFPISGPTNPAFSERQSYPGLKTSPRPPSPRPYRSPSPSLPACSPIYCHYSPSELILPMEKPVFVQRPFIFNSDKSIAKAPMLKDLGLKAFLFLCQTHDA